MVINERHRLGIPDGGRGPRSLKLPLLLQWEQSPVWVPSGSHLGSLGQDLTVSLSWQQGHPCGEEEEREEEK